VNPNRAGAVRRRGCDREACHESGEDQREHADDHDDTENERTAPAVQRSLVVRHVAGEFRLVLVFIHGGISLPCWASRWRLLAMRLGEVVIDYLVCQK
jgi:hypothetical protein